MLIQFGQIKRTLHIISLMAVVTYDNEGHLMEISNQTLHDNKHKVPLKT